MNLYSVSNRQSCESQIRISSLSLTGRRAACALRLGCAHEPARNSLHGHLETLLLRQTSPGQDARRSRVTRPLICGRIDASTPPGCLRRATPSASHCSVAISIDCGALPIKRQREALPLLSHVDVSCGDEHGDGVMTSELLLNSTGISSVSMKSMDEPGTSEAGV